MNAIYLKEPGVGAKARKREVRRTVSAILIDIEERGIEAVRDYSRKFDDWDPDSFLVAPEVISAAREQVDTDLCIHIAFAQEQVRTFAAAQLTTLGGLEIETLPGVTLGHRHIPVRSVGSYVPGGRYPMLASSFMTVLVAKVAGVERVVACAPPQGACGPHPAMIYAMQTSGADAIVCIGGVQAMAALVWGHIDGVEPVDMIVGAGNAYVAEAKRQLFGEVGIDLLAGPTEVLVIADSTADPELVAADLLGQAEHGPDSAAGLIATDEETARCVMDAVDELLEAWPTAETAGPAWREQGWVALVDDDDAAIALSDSYAPEHLEVQVDEARTDYYLEHLSCYGSLFLGAEATVAYGDKAVGTNHVLPTRGAARYTGGLWVGKFLRTVTWQRLTPEGTAQVAPAVAAISRAEGFEGHALTADMRLARSEGLDR